MTASVVACLGLAGCIGDGFGHGRCQAPVVQFDPGAPCPAAQRYPAPEPPTSPDGFLTIDDQYSWVATQVPGFGGAYLDDGGVLVVYLVDPTPAGADAARSALAEVFHDPAVLQLAVEARRGRHDSLQLMDARSQLMSNFLDGLAFMDASSASGDLIARRAFVRSRRVAK